MGATPRQIYEIPITWDSNNRSQPILVSNFRNVGLTVVGTGNVSVLASKSAPAGGEKGTKVIDFNSASTINNSYATVAIYDETVLVNNWVLSLVVAGSTKLGEVDINELSWICLQRSGSGVDASVTVADNL